MFDPSWFEGYLPGFVDEYMEGVTSTGTQWTILVVKNFQARRVREWSPRIPVDFFVRELAFRLTPRSRRRWTVLVYLCARGQVLESSDPVSIERYASAPQARERMRQLAEGFRVNGNGDIVVPQWK